MINFFKRISLPIYALMLTVSCFAEIISTAKVDEVHALIEPKLKQFKPRELLVIFDVDNTLSFPAHTATYFGNVSKYTAPFNCLMQDLSVEQRDMALAFAEQSNTEKLRLIETKLPEVIKSLQEKKVPVIAFSSTLTGPLGATERLEVTRFNKLEEAGLNFQEAFRRKEIIFSKIPAYNGQHPIYYKGLLCSNGEHREQGRESTIIGFLKGIKLSPAALFMIDAKQANLERVQSALKAYDPSISFVGVHYTAAAPLNIAQAEFTSFWQKIVEKVKYMSNTIADKSNTMKEKVADKAVEVKDKTIELTHQAMEKAGELKDKAVDKTIELKDKACDLKDKAVDKAIELKDKAFNKGEHLKEEASEKAEEAKDTASQKAKELNQAVKEHTDRPENKTISPNNTIHN